MKDAIRVRGYGQDPDVHGHDVQIVYDADV